MRVLFLTDKFLPERGGSQVLFGNLYKQLSDHQVTILTRSAPGDAACDAEFPHEVIRFPYPTIPKVRSLLFGRKLLAEGRRLLKQEKFDQIHAGQPLETGPTALRLAREFGLPCLVHTFAEDVTSYENHRLFGGIMRRTLRSASAVTTISRFMRDRLIKLGVAPDRIVLHYPGIGIDPDLSCETEAQIRARLGLEGKRVLLTVARLITRKGHDTVLQALPSILQQVPDAEYVIVGDGPEKPRLQDLARQLGVSDHVRFTGSLGDAERVALYRAADVFVMPNRRMPNGEVEGFGIVFLEANACGKPVIGGDSGGTPDAIVHGETGYLVDPTNVEEVARRAVELLSDPVLARRMGDLGRERALEEFTWHRSSDAVRQAMAICAS